MHTTMVFFALENLPTRNHVHLLVEMCTPRLTSLSDNIFKLLINGYPTLTLHDKKFSRIESISRNHRQFLSWSRLWSPHLKILKRIFVYFQIINPTIEKVPQITFQPIQYRWMVYLPYPSIYRAQRHISLHSHMLIFSYPYFNRHLYSSKF